MSLQVWYPFTGDIENKGMYNVAPVDANYTTDSSGKLGACIKFATNGAFTTQVPFDVWDYSKKSISFAAWIKINQAELNAKTSTYTYDSTYSTAGGSLIGRHAYKGLALRWKTNNIYSSGSLSSVAVYMAARDNASHSYATSGKTISWDTWTHVVGIFNREKSQLQLYIDGELFASANINIAYFTASTILSSNLFLNYGEWDGGNGRSANAPWYVNDVRVYDHALSLKEVKEISKGLMLHYKLDNVYLNNTNLFSNTDFNGSSQKFTLTSGTEGGFTYTPTETLTPDTIYTVSCYLRGNANMVLYKLCSGGNEQMYWANRAELSPTEYQYYSISFSFPSTKTLNSLYICTRYGTTNSAVGDWFEIRPYSLKLEKGSIATPWSPAPSDALYSTLGYDKIHGVTGLGYHNSNLATSYVMPGGNVPSNTATAGRTQYYGPSGIKIPATENADTYFSVWLSATPKINNIYTFSCNASGLLPGTYYNFPLFTQNNTSMGILIIDHNGRCFLTFKMTYADSITTTTYNGQTLYRLFLDDQGRNIASGQGAIILTDFRLDPGVGEEAMSQWSYNTTGTITTSSDTKRYATSCYIDSENNTTNTAAGTVYLEAPCWLENATQLTTAFWCKPINGYGSTADQGQFCLTLNGSGSDYNSVPMHHRDASIDMTATNGTDYRVTMYFVKNEWHHYAIVYNTNICYIYRDGVKIATSSTMASPLKPCQKLIIGFSKAGGVWRSNKSYYSDFRIYSTALSDADVLELYQTSASIEKNGNYYTRELIEK